MICVANFVYPRYTALTCKIYCILGQLCRKIVDVDQMYTEKDALECHIFFQRIQIRSQRKLDR